MPWQHLLSYVVAPLESDTESPNPMAYAHNVSMFIEADVMETPSDLMYFVPKKYCLEDLGVDNNNAKFNDKFGMSAILGNTHEYRNSQGDILGYAPEDRVNSNVEIPNDSPFLDTMPNAFTATSHERTIGLGTQQLLFITQLNRLGRIIAWAHKI